MSGIPWRRVRRGLAQYARQRHRDPQRIEGILKVLQRLQSLCGDGSQSRQNMYHLGCALFADRPSLFVPVCPDYTNDGHRYTYRGLGNGLPLVFKYHLPFVQMVQRIVHRLQVTILIADHEGELTDFLKPLQVTSDEFRARVTATRTAIQRASQKGWKVALFTEMFPNFLQTAWTEAEVLLADAHTRARLEMDTIARGRLYDRLGYPMQGRLEKTAHVAGQYLLLGREVSARSAIVCNHTTTSLSWYRTAHAAILHNPVVIY